MTGLINSAHSEPDPQKLYLFMVDFLDAAFNADALFIYLRDSYAITRWSNPLPGVFMFKSSLSGPYLSEALRRIVNGAKCLLIEGNPNNKGGWLPKEAWEWFNPPKAALPVLSSMDFLTGQKKE